MSATIQATPRSTALFIAGCNTRLEDRIAFAEAILPLVERYDQALPWVLYVDQLLPKGIPAAQWAALAADHLAFLLPKPEDRAVDAAIARALAERWSI